MFLIPKVCIEICVGSNIFIQTKKRNNMTTDAKKNIHKQSK